MKLKKIYQTLLVNVHISIKMALLFVVLLLSITADAQTWTLHQCLDTAQMHNKNLQMSRNLQQLSGEREKEAKANVLPKLKLNADYKYFSDLPYQIMPQSAFGGPVGQFKEIQMGVPHNTGTNIQLNMPLYNSQIFNGIEATKIASEITDLQYKKTEEQVFYEISNLYFNAQILIHQQLFLDSNVVNTNQLLNTLTLLHEQLMVKRSDVTKVELQKQQLLTNRERVAISYEQVMNALKFSMGVPIQQEMQLELEIINKSPVDYPQMLPIDLRLTQTQNKLLNSELSSLKMSRLPSLFLLGSYGQTGFGYDEKPNEFLKFYPTTFVGLQFSMPLFNGTITQRKISQKKLEIKNNQLQIELVQEQNKMQVHNALRKRMLAGQTIENSDGQIKLASTIYQEMLLQQREGTANLTEILLADNALREAQQSYLSAIVDYLKADLELKKLTGNITIKH